jgi:Ca-activated chloride channel family protein
MSVILKRVLATFTVVTTAAGATLYAQAPVHREQATFRSAVDVVSIQASVRDKRGRPLTGLTAADIEVRDNGQPRPILSMRSDQTSPVSLAILVDLSGSMRVGAKMTMVREALDTLVSQLHEGQDEVGLFTFDAELQERRPFSSTFAGIGSALDGARPFGTTSLYDAAAATARQVAGRPAAHKAIIILTDGIDTSSALTPSEVSGLASSIDVPVYVVATVPAVDQVTIMEGSGRSSSRTGADLRDLAEWTGGQLVFTRTAADNVTLASTLLRELRERYVIAIEAADSREWRRLEVRVRRSSATVRARSGYFGG